MRSLYLSQLQQVLPLVILPEKRLIQTDITTSGQMTERLDLGNIQVHA
jgi:hypothetical protein